jgi:hypothetical protein
MFNNVDRVPSGAGPRARSTAVLKPPRRMGALLRSAALLLGGISIYLLATLSCLAAGWLLPGRGIGTIGVRAVLGCTIPAVAAIWLQKWLRNRNLKPLAIALLVGMLLVGLACIGGAIGMVVGFRILDG